MGVWVSFVGERFDCSPDRSFVMGREGDLVIDDNPYLHRRFLEIQKIDGLWWLVNVGSLTAATVGDGDGGLQAWVSPGSRIPIVVPRLIVWFTAGPTLYELEIHSDEAQFAVRPIDPVSDGHSTIGPTSFTLAQRLVIIALAEPLLTRDARGSAAIPTSAAAAKRLGWTLTRFNRKLDNVCDKLDRLGVQGLHGGPGKLATGRRTRLVEYAVSARLVTEGDLSLLDHPHVGDEPDD